MTERISIAERQSGREALRKFVCSSDQKKKIARALSLRLSAISGSILDVGAGDGQLLEEIEAVGGISGHRIDVLDTDEKALRVLQGRHRLIPKLGNVIVADMEEFVASERYDVVLSIHSLYRVYEQGGIRALRQTIHKLWTYTSEGGYLIIGVVDSKQSELFQMRKALLPEGFPMLSDIVLRFVFSIDKIAFEEKAVSSKVDTSSVDMPWLSRFVLGASYARWPEFFGVGRFEQAFMSIYGASKNRQLESSSTLFIIRGAVPKQQ